MKITRRYFLEKIVNRGLAAASMPYVITSSALGQGVVSSASQRITLGHIGVGDRGTTLLQSFLEVDEAQSVAVCDPFGKRQIEAAERINKKYAKRKTSGEYKGCTCYTDFRELLARPDIDAVVIATPDHWHMPIAIEAVRAGKDVYVEKPLGLSIEQNKVMRSVLKRYGRLFQYGTQQRSNFKHCALACERVRSGCLGRLKEIQVVAPAGESGGSTQPAPVPDGFDYNLWLGPAPYTPYTEDRCTASGSYYVYDNSIGFLGGWGAHPLDVMHWGYPHIPVEYEGTGTIPREGLFDAITHWNVRGHFEDGVRFVFTTGEPDLTTFIGENGWIAAGRYSIDAEPRSLMTSPSGSGGIRLSRLGDHYEDFIRCVKSRQSPISDIDSAVQSDFVSHLCDIAIRTGQKIKWDPQKEAIIDNSTADRMTTRPMRSPWTL